MNTINKSLSRICALLLSAGIILTGLISCSSGGNGGSGTTGAGGKSDGTKSGGSSAAETTTTVGWASSGVPKTDYKGYKFTILSTKPSYDYAWWMLDEENLNGEPLNDAIYQRNKTIEEVFNIEIGVTYTSNFTTDVQKSVNAGDSAFDMAFGAIGNQLTMAQSGYLYDLFKMPYIDLDKQWWDQNLKNDLTIGGHLFFEIGDISPIMNVRTFALVFNKDLCKKLGLEYPYQYVLDGKWTLDMFGKYCKGVNRDLNGDSVMDYEDQWGYFSQKGNSYMSYLSAGGRVAEVGSDGVPKIVMDTSKNMDIMTKALKISSDQEVTLMADAYVAANGGSWPAASSWFASGGSLMRSSVFEPVPRDYRSMETDFGVLPYPKYSEDQEKYYSLPETTGWVVSIPASIVDADRTGMIVEALAAESVSTVSNAFYDVCLDGKYVRDEESKAMLDIIFDNKIYDIGYILNIGSFTGQINNLEAAGNTDVASLYASIKSTAQASLDKLVEAFNKL